MPKRILSREYLESLRTGDEQEARCCLCAVKLRDTALALSDRVRELEDKLAADEIERFREKVAILEACLQIAGRG